MKAFLLSLSILIVVTATQTVRADNFLTEDEIQNSQLSENEKALAASSLLLEPTIKCLSPNEGLGSDSERLRIYFISIGNVFSASVAVWKTQTHLRVYGSFAKSDDLKNAFANNGTLSFGSSANNFTDQTLSVHFGQLIPMVGKVAGLKFANSDGVAEQICSLSKK